MSRPGASRVADGLALGLAVAPWVLAGWRWWRVSQVAPMDAVAWYRVAQACRSAGLGVGRAGLWAEAHYWRVVGGGR